MWFRTRKLLPFVSLMLFLLSFVFAFFAYQTYMNPSFTLLGGGDGDGISARRMRMKLEPYQDNPRIREIYDLALADERRVKRNAALLLTASLVCVVGGCTLIATTLRCKNSGRSSESPLKTDEREP